MDCLVLQQYWCELARCSGLHRKTAMCTFITFSLNSGFRFDHKKPDSLERQNLFFTKKDTLQYLKSHVSC